MGKGIRQRPSPQLRVQACDRVPELLTCGGRQEWQDPLKQVPRLDNVLKPVRRTRTHRVRDL